MHPPFHPRPAARPNPKNGAFKDSPRELRELSAAIDADAQIKSRRVTLAKMLMARGEDKDSAFREVDGALYEAWDSAKGADRLNALSLALNQMKRELDASAKQSSLTGATEEDTDTEIEVEGVSAAEAEERVGAEARQEAKSKALASYGLTPELYAALVEGMIGKKGNLVKRTDDNTLAQLHGVSTKDIATLRSTAVSLALFSQQMPSLIDKDELENWVDRLT